MLKSHSPPDNPDSWLCFTGQKTLLLPPPKTAEEGLLDPTHLVSSLSTCVTLVNVLNLSVPFFEHW